ncbi:carboxypeptidase regulatory-like domain-containing protein [Cyanobacterium stanieri LEGE 03274]|uniref:Carboxypeptidase regulatory-like domain-containing protein n=1 Tax=Cyanobacterium stanieri LEGE 03274 TaxID=1828756 RepID=A0ABR9V1Z0_9CHRO|nr:carboxypeptidase-like regulatory domain-containing protein [Cyanobacterium stanieri]MBE9221910.1 carboxypeptidase regulatory-like domain-containing protein [Cyanobacterium stanieri LEGE 03274]
MLKKSLWFSSILIISTLFSPVKTSAHGVLLEYEKVGAIALKAQYDTGQPMKNAQVLIYAPDTSQEPYLQGITDENGNFTFYPAQNTTGTWTVKVTTAGHGSIINIPILSSDVGKITPDNNINNQENNNVIFNSSQGQISNNISATPNNGQKLLMAMSGVWGLVGTALFFSRSNKEKFQ